MEKAAKTDGGVDVTLWKASIRCLMLIDALPDLPTLSLAPEAFFDLVITWTKNQRLPLPLHLSIPHLLVLPLRRVFPHSLGWESDVED